MHVANLPGRARRGVTYNIMSVGRCRTMWVSNGYALQHASVEVQADREAVGRWARVNRKAIEEPVDLLDLVLLVGVKVVRLRYRYGLS